MTREEVIAQYMSKKKTLQTVLDMRKERDVATKDLETEFRSEDRERLIRRVPEGPLRKLLDATFERVKSKHEVMLANNAEIDARIAKTQADLKEIEIMLGIS